METAASVEKHKRDSLSSSFCMRSLEEGDSVVFSNFNTINSVNAEREVQHFLQSMQITSSHEIVWTDGVLGRTRDHDQDNWYDRFPCRIVVVTAIPAYHCEGSVFFLFQQFCGKV